MLIEFKVQNFLSFKDLTTFSMVCMKSFKEHQENNTFYGTNKIRLLKTATIQGNNGSGKSNLIKSIAFARSFALNSYRDALIEEDNQKIAIHKFLLNKSCDNLPSHFEFSFIVNETIYRYGFELETDRVCKEWLFRTTTKEVPLFIRDEHSIYVNNVSFKEGLELKSKLETKNAISSPVLFLTRIAHDEGEISKIVISWLRKINIINGIYDIPYKKITIKKLKNDIDFQKWVGRFMLFLEINKLSITEKDVDDLGIDRLKNIETDEDVINLLVNIQKIQSKQPKDQILSWHRRYDENNFLIDTIPFDFDRDESGGTKKLVYLLGLWYDTLKEGKILIVDELEAQLHGNLVKYLLHFFHENNTNHAQLVFVTHNTSILDKTYLRRDQIWFVEKDQFGASTLYSLGDFSSEQVRNKSAFDKNYIEGKYGAIPYFEETDKLMTLLHDKK